MSCTRIIAFGKDGYPYFYGEVDNAWLSAFAIWSQMEEKYLPKYRPSYIPKHIPDDEIKLYLGYEPTRVTSMHKMEAIQEIWDLVDSKDISESERIVMCSTFDKPILRKENFQRVIDAFNDYPGETSLKEQAVIIKKMLNDDNVIALAWNQTSVTHPLWMGKYATLNDEYNPEIDDEEKEYINYNCLTGDVHFWMMDDIDEITTNMNGKS